MTIVVAAINRDFTVQVSDRRLTASAGDGSTWTFSEEENKSIAWTLPSARFAVGYSGIARIGKEPMNRLLGQAMLHAAQLANYIPQLAIENLADILTRQLATVRDRSSARLSVIVTGFVIQSDGGHALVQALLSNYQDWGVGDAPQACSEVVPTFRHAKAGVEWPTEVQRIGVYSLLGPEDACSLRLLLAKGKPATATRDKIIELLRGWSIRAPTIGLSANSLVLPAKPELSPYWAYHAHSSGDTYYVGDTVISLPESSFSAAEMQITKLGPGPPMVVPMPSSRRVPCPCGSGKRYNICHGREQRPGGY